MTMPERHGLIPEAGRKGLTVREIEEISKLPFNRKGIEAAVKARDEADKRLKARGISVIL